MRILLSLAILAPLAGVGHAAGNMKLGPVQVKPHATLDGRYDDNLFLQASGSEKSSSILEGHIGTGFKLEGARQKVQASYDFGRLMYDRFSGANNASHHDANASYEYSLANEGKVGVSDRYLRTTDPASSEFTDRTKRNQNEARATAEFPVGSKMYFGLNVGHTLQDYLKASVGDVLDRTEISAAPRFGYQLTGKTRAFVEYRYMQTEFDVSTVRDSKGHEASLGLEGELTGRITGSVQAGVAMRKYDNAVTGEDSDVTTPSFGAMLTWAAPSDVKVSLFGMRKYQESSFNRHYENNYLGLTATHALPIGLEMTANASYGIDQYPTATTVGAKTAKREDKLSQVGLALAQPFAENFKFTAGYTLRFRDSNFSTYDYDNSVVTLGFGASF